MGIKLTGKQQLFINAYLLTNNATQSAITAGYSVRTARTQGQANLTKHAIKQVIDKARAKIQTSHDITMAEVVGNARQLVSRGLDPEPIKDIKGKVTGIYKYDSQAVAKGNTQLMQLGNLGTPEKGNGDTNIQINIVNYGTNK